MSSRPSASRRPLRTPRVRARPVGGTAATGLAATVAACCPGVLQGRLSPAAATRLATVFKVIADAARLRLVSLIAAQPTGEACVCQLTRPLGLSQPTVSHHLKMLHGAGILEREQRGTWAFYRVRPEALTALRDALAPESP